MRQDVQDEDGGIKWQGTRTDLTSPKISAKSRSDDEIGQKVGVSGDTIRNYIALTQLVPELQQVPQKLGNAQMLITSATVTSLLKSHRFFNRHSRSKVSSG